MTCAGLNLVIPDKPDPERDAVAAAWKAGGGSVTRIGRFWDPPVLARPTVRLYGNDSFVQVLAQKLELTLVSPADDLLIHFAPELLQRALDIRSLADAAAVDLPRFVKPVVPKQFRAAIYRNPAELAAETHGLPPDTAVYVAEPVRFLAEARAFVLDGEVLDLAIYEGPGELRDARALLDRAARSMALPPTCVLDVGLIADRGWAIVEANASWGSGLNGCVAEKVLPCIAAATRLPV